MKITSLQISVMQYEPLQADLGGWYADIAWGVEPYFQITVVICLHNDKNLQETPPLQFADQSHSRAHGTKSLVQQEEAEIMPFSPARPNGSSVLLRVGYFKIRT